MELTIGSRGSKLALWQSEWVKARLEELDASVSVRIEIFKTSGDVMRDVPLSVIGGQGAFTKELEHALIEGRIDIAVHSLKDLPTVNPAELSITAVPPREDVRDALVLRAGSDGNAGAAEGDGAEGGGPSVGRLREGATVGTSSLRRIAQLKHLRPDVQIKDLRGNVDTRLRKLDEGEYDAIILAAAGLRRLGFAGRISAPIETAEMVPAVSQGALGVQTRADAEGTNALVSRLDHAPARAAVTAERAFLRRLGGGCQVPIAAHAVAEGDRLRLKGLVASLSGESVLRDEAEGDAARADELGERLAEQMLERGAGRLLEGVPLLIQR
ncbi:MAG TPA: hydroxymethylbilane synthase [Pyrinomonadaceae bacterium]|nr:hydroxymethylbilane synthase [Pyrinomonadaceae bacterium]